MPSTRTRRARVLLFTLLLALAPPAAAGRKSAGDQNGEQKEEPKWEVEKPLVPGQWKTATIDTGETTWSNLDLSPDGSTLVFDMLGDIYQVPIAGGEATALTSGIAWDTEPRFSPDGRRIAFVSDRGGADNLWVMAPDGTAPKAVSAEKEHLVHNPWWSPDGQYLLAKKDFTSTRSIPAGEIWIFSLGGGEGLPLIERPDGKKAQKNIAEPAFSPDGRHVYFSQDVSPGQAWQYNKDATGELFVIKRLERSTGEVEVLVGGAGGAIRPTPSHDGRRLAFVKRTPAFTSALYVKDLASGLEIPLYDRLDRDLQESDGSQGNTPAFAWTPDDAAIVFWAGGRFRRVDLHSRQVSVIPVRIRTTRQVRNALRFPVAVAPDQVEVKLLRWVSVTPDGKQVVFQALGHLYARELAAGAAPRRLTTQDDHFEFYPSISRDGRWVVYTSWDDEQLGQVRVVPIGGGTGRVVTTDPGIYLEPRFSPDGQSIVYRKSTGGYLLSGQWSMEPGLYLVPAAGGAPRRLTRAGRLPQFAAASDRVYFTDSIDESTLVLKSVDLLGHDERTHVKGTEATEWSLSPDGRWLAFTEKWNAWVVPYTPTGKTIELGSEAKGIPIRRVSARSGQGLSWSGASDRLHWTNGHTLYSRDLKDAFAFLAEAPDKLPEPVTVGTDLGFRVPADRPASSLVLSGGRVVTMRDADRTEEVLSDGVVVIAGNRIAAVGRRGEVAVPPGATTIDVSGKTIVPGLVDVHAHGAAAQEGLTPEQNWIHYAELAFGVTTLHDPSNDTESIFAAAELQRAGTVVGPRLFSTGTILYGAHIPGATAEIASLEDARFHVRRMKDAGAISLKSYQQPRRDQRQQLIEAAAEAGLMVVPEGGMKFQHNMNQIIDGHTGIEHALPVAAAYEDVRQLWSQSGTGYTPTFVVAYGGLMGEEYWYQHSEVWKNQRLMRFVPRFLVEPRAMRRRMAPEEHFNHFYVARLAHALRERGVSVQIGAHGQREGLGAHWEMWMMVQGGFTPWQALRGATRDGARYVGLDRDIGSIEPGKLADLAIIDGDPLSDIRQSERVVLTVLNGRLYDAPTMNQLAPDSRARQPFYFEREGGDTIHPQTTAWLEGLRQRLGWND